MPTIIKRYPNRKLYNTETKRYITLDGISTLIKQSNEVQVLDHTTGEDLTTLTLTQIIFEQEKTRWLSAQISINRPYSGGGERIGRCGAHWACCWTCCVRLMMRSSVA